MSITFEVVPAEEVPEARGRQRRRKPTSPIDIALGDFLRANPGKWVAYPVSEFWPDINPRTLDGLRTLSQRVGAKLGEGRVTKARKTPVGAFVPLNESGRFMSRIDHDRHRILVSYTAEEF